MFFDEPESVLLVDFNNLLFRTLYVREVYVQSEMPDFKLWRYLVYDSIYSCIKKFHVSEVVLAVDDKVSWRRSFFPRYKESRKKQRDKSDVDFGKVFGVVNKYIAELKHSMPFKIIKCRSAEADDIIGTLALQFDDRYDLIISSNDEDFLQLANNNVRVWNPSRQEFSEFPINLHKKDDPVLAHNPEEFLQYKILMGQSKDDIFNILTPSSWGLTEGTEGKRRPGLGPKTAKRIIEQTGFDEWIKSRQLEDRLKRNSVLIDFKKIPHTIQNRVITAFNDYNYPPPENIYRFFKQYDFRSYLETFDYIEPNLMRLY